MEVNCKHCGLPVTVETPYQRNRIRLGMGIFCNTICSKAYCSIIHSQTASRTNRKYASARMIANNPMKQESSRNKMSETLKAIGHKPAIIGGNGRGATKQQKALHDVLTGWIMEFAIPTGHKQQSGSGYPTCYKLDIAHPYKKIGVEVDGNSHTAYSVRAMDEKKESFLNGLGWTILRFTNEEIDSDLNRCAIKVLSVACSL